MKALYVLVLLAALSFFAYIFFIGNTVFLLVNTKNIEAEQRAIAAEISELELSTLAMNDTLTIEKAYALGFVDAPDTRFTTMVSLATPR